MTKGQEIAQQNATNLIKVDGVRLLAKEIDAAIADAEQRQRERCAEAYIKSDPYKTYNEHSVQAILNAVKPKVPVWCEHIQWTDSPGLSAGHDWWYIPSVGIPYNCFSFKFCPFCGKAKPEAKND